MAFRIRHLGNNLKTIKNMLSKQSSSDLEHFIERVIPSSISLKNNNFSSNISLMIDKSENESLSTIKGYFKSKSENYKNSKNVNTDTQNKYMIGMDFNETETPSVIVRNLLENPKWYTAYTPYQAEISQGRLESLFNFQTMVCELTDLPVSNCSLLDSASASSEALSVAYNFHK